MLTRRILHSAIISLLVALIVTTVLWLFSSATLWTLLLEGYYAWLACVLLILAWDWALDIYHRFPYANRFLVRSGFYLIMTGLGCLLAQIVHEFLLLLGLKGGPVACIACCIFIFFVFLRIWSWV